MQGSASRVVRAVLGAVVPARHRVAWVRVADQVSTRLMEGMGMGMGIWGPASGRGECGDACIEERKTTRLLKVPRRRHK